MGTYNHSYKSTYKLLRGLIRRVIIRVISTMNLQAGACVPAREPTEAWEGKGSPQAQVLEQLLFGCRVQEQGSGFRV